MAATTLARAVALALAAALALGGCEAPKDARSAAPPLVWPAEPEPARVAYVGAFSEPADLGIRKSLLQRLGDLLFGAESARLVRPMAVVESAGVLFIADPGARGVHRYDRRGGGYELLRGPGGAALPSPVALARGADGEVFVADSALAQVFVLKPGADAAEPLATDQPLRQPTGLAVDRATRRLYVADTAAHRVLVFERDGRLVATIGARGTGDGEFNYPTLLWHGRDGRLFVTDSLNFRIQIFDTQGRFAARLGRHGDSAGDLARHKGVATDRAGHVYVVDSLLHALQIFDEQGRFLLGIGGQGHGAGEFWLPVGLFIGDDDTIYVADSYNRRVQVFRYVGATP